MIHTHTNRLINSTSPYLLQHAHNPVDWYEWGEEALMAAKQENKPILVSIGYSSCHWCHVMEREVFETEELARIMNEYLICIKVDREERPDIDQIYMDAVQAMGVHGGWPLNVFLTPDQKPFYGGTYFPPEQWQQVVVGIHRAFNERRQEVEESAEQFAQHLTQNNFSHLKKESANPTFNADLDAMYSKLEEAFDRTWGGLDKAPKFIMPSVWMWLLRYHHLTGDDNVLQQVVLTLDRIARGGIYDQIGGGFARYSVDGYWFAPHFEKMLYDNAQLISLYSEAYIVTGNQPFKTVVEETFQWLQTEMMHPEGGFYSALDADSEGVEGKFYTWTMQELDEILGDDSDPIKMWYSVKPEGNWEHGRNILFRSISEDKFLTNYGIVPGDWNKKLREVKDKLLEVRDKRTRPGLDEKIITSWNAMMVIGLTDAYRATRNERYVNLAKKNMAFLERELSDGKTLYRSWKGGKRSHIEGFLDDYAWTILACIRLYEVTFEEYWVKRAELLTTHVIDDFLDSADGLFFYTGKYRERLIAQRKEVFDNVIPASNSVMARGLFYLGVLLDKQTWKDMARNMTLPFGQVITSEPNYMSNWGIAYTEINRGIAEVVVVGRDAEEMRKEFHLHFNPFVLTMGTMSVSELPLIAGKGELNGRTAIYVCYDKACRKPVSTVEEALTELDH